MPGDVRCVNGKSDFGKKLNSNKQIRILKKKMRRPKEGLLKRLLLNFTSNAIKLVKWTEIFYPQILPQIESNVPLHHRQTASLFLSYSCIIFPVLIHEYHKMDINFACSETFQFRIFHSFSFAIVFVLMKSKIAQTKLHSIHSVSMDSNQMKISHFDVSFGQFFK
ncbi:hypothetical protein ACKWTF_008056 [Chironomus riparius]